jgi:hypothetical protein
MWACDGIKWFSPLHKTFLANKYLNTCQDNTLSLTRSTRPYLMTSHVSSIEHLMVCVLAPLNRLQINSFLDHLPQGTHISQSSNMIFQQVQQKVYLSF